MEYVQALSSILGSKMDSFQPPEAHDSVSPRAQRRFARICPEKSQEALLLVHHYELSQAKKTRYNKRIGFIMMNKQWFVHMNYTMACETCQRFSEEDVNVTVK